MKITREASVLGLPPGHWPTELRAEGRTWKKKKTYWSMNGEELLSVLYVPTDQYTPGAPTELLVFND